MITLHCSTCPATKTVHLTHLPAELPDGWSGGPNSTVLCKRCQRIAGKPYGPMVTATSVPEMREALRAAIADEAMPVGQGVEEVFDLLAGPVITAMTERADRARTLAVHQARRNIAARLDLI